MRAAERFSWMLSCAEETDYSCGCYTCGDSCGGGVWWWFKAPKQWISHTEIILRRGNKDAVAQLIADGADVNELLFEAAGSAKRDIVLFLLGRGADINSKGTMGLTSLHWAIINGNMEVEKFLIEQGADVNAQDDIGYTPWTYLMMMGKSVPQDLERLFLDKGADLGLIIGPEGIQFPQLVGSGEQRELWLQRTAGIGKELSKKGLPAEMIIKILERGRPQKFPPEVRDEILKRVYYEKK